MTARYQTIGFDWHGIPVSVVFCPDWSKAWRAVQGYPLWHLKISSDGRRPLPISDTGFRSHFVSGAVLDDWGGPLPYVRTWLDCEAERPDWQAAELARRQLTLF